MYNREKILQTCRDVTKDFYKSTKPYVYIAQPRRDLDETPAQHLSGIPCHVDILGYSNAFCNIGGEKVDVARNLLIDHVLESEAKYLFFIGEDTVVPYDGFTKLHEIAEKNPDTMVVGVYFIKISSPMIHVREGDYIKPADVTPGQLLEVESCGLDCALIPVKNLREMKDSDPENPFCVIACGIKDGDEELPFIGEDNYFTYRWRSMGYRILCNTDVQCLHMDLLTGKYTAHPSVNLDNYYTNIEITEPLTLADKKFIDKRWIDRIPKGSYIEEEN